ncbi:putative Polygalacturonase [Quillaja saponaria]|uniref:endo-polygalacturonase n=1 Tax=Quillaja saponaria TaxID=32244 RepID=A0AAD7QKB0_QUISA|nr:putative Polygalacturonase [Quillaja saponaria]
MIPQRPLLLLFVSTLASFTTCFGSFKEDLAVTNNKYMPHYVKQPESFGLISRFNRAIPLSVSSKMVSVDDYGAKGDGGDDAKAFEEAWNKACSERVDLVVPKYRTYHLKPIIFYGPCHSNFVLKIYGTIKASINISDYEKDRRHWLLFKNLTNFRVEGGGIINGNGRKWWENSCKINKTLPCKHPPTAVTFSECNNLRVKNLRIQNPQQMHLSFGNCVNVKVSNLIITAPGDSPNTDGIHVTGTQNIQIKKCVIGTGDDCISIKSGSTNVKATDIVCGPGHGISIGSLGAGNSEANVSNVLVNRAKLSGTTNGVRIKTWQGGSGYAKDIKFQNIAMQNVTNPIIINQDYCDQEKSCSEQVKAVQVSNVVYKNIGGTSASEVVIKFECSKSFPCKGIWMQNINLVREGNGNVKGSCVNIRYSSRGKISPQCLIEKLTS